RGRGGGGGGVDGGAGGERQAPGLDREGVADVLGPQAQRARPPPREAVRLEDEGGLAEDGRERERLPHERAAGGVPAERAGQRQRQERQAGAAPPPAHPGGRGEDRAGRARRGGGVGRPR